MSNEINLLTKKDKKLLKNQGKLKVFRLIAIGFLISILIVSFSIFLLNHQLSNSSIEKDQESVLVEMKPFIEKEAKIIIINNRIENISKVLTKRIDVFKIINTIVSEIPNGIFIEGLVFKESKISINVTALSLTDIDALFNGLIELAKRKENIKNLTLESFDASGLTGSYKFTLSMNI